MCQILADEVYFPHSALRSILQMMREEDPSKVIVQRWKDGYWNQIVPLQNPGLLTLVVLYLKIFFLVAHRNNLPKLSQAMFIIQLTLITIKTWSFPQNAAVRAGGGGQFSWWSAQLVSAGPSYHVRSQAWYRLLWSSLGRWRWKDPWGLLTKTVNFRFSEKILPPK